VARQPRQVHVAIHRETFTNELEHQLSRAGRGQRAEHGDQSHILHTEVLSAKLVMTWIQESLFALLHGYQG
jgi:hypothetical protein